MGEFTMPSLGADMDEGTLQEWLVTPGARVARGDVVAVVETDKSTIEVECFEAGTVTRLLVEPGTRVPVGTPLAVIGTAEAAVPTDSEGPGRTGETEGAAVTAPVVRAAGPVSQEPSMPQFEVVAVPCEVAGPTGAFGDGAVAVGRTRPAARGAERQRSAPPPVTAVDASPSTPGVPGEVPSVPAVEHAAASVAAGAGQGAGLSAGPGLSAAPGPPVVPDLTATVSPLVRRLAKERHLDPARIRGTGRGGRVTRRDVERAAAARPRVRATPYARRVAEDLHVDLAQVRGTGESGAVRVADVREAARAAAPGRTGERAADVRETDAPRRTPAPVAPATTEERSAAMRRAIAALMARSKREVPHYYLSTTIDLHSALTWLRARNRERLVPERLLPAALLLRAAALAARQVPALNGFWVDDRFQPGDGVHLGVAVSLRGGGLLTPVIHHADTLELPALMAALKDIASRARAGRLRGSELTGATLTVTNLGEQGVETVFGVIHPPQVALVGFGAVTDRPCAVNGLLGVRPTVTASLSGDHRATDGAVGAHYLTVLNRLLQQPEES